MIKIADVKWIKIYTGMINNKKIKLIRKLPEGNNVILIWVFLLTTAGECNRNGGLFITDAIPFEEGDLATEFGFDVSVIKFALITLVKYEMVEIFEDVIYIKNWSEYQNIDGLDKVREQSRARVQRFRESRRLAQGCLTCQYCGSDATGYDHVIATAKGGSDADINKIPCCIDCNRIKNDKNVVDFLNNNRSRINDEIVLSNDILTSLVTLCNVTDRYQVTQSNATDKTKSKTKKEKEIKNTYSEFVTMTTTEHDRLVNEFGQDAVNRMIEILNNYKGSKGAKYASDNLAIRSWVIKRYQEEQNQTKLFADKPKMSKREQQLDELGRIMDDYDRCNSQKATDDVFCELPEPW